MTLYFSGLTYRDSCYSCRFSSAERCSDITIGDFWQYKETMGKKEAPGGMSLVLVNTEKGQRVTEKMTGSYKEECDVDSLLKAQSSFGANTEKTASVYKFREDYKNLGIEFIGNLSSQVQQQIGKDFRGGVPVEAFARTMIQLFCKLGQSLCRKRNLIGVLGMYCRSRPLICSFDPLSHGDMGCAK